MSDDALGPSLALVIPCYKEAKRWSVDYWSRIASFPQLTLVFVDDGSNDMTGQILHDFASKTASRVVALDRNRGKAEAIRQGMLLALQDAPHGIGYLDADGAFPVDEVHRILNLFVADEHGAASLWSSRVRMAGRDIRRRPLRHYLGRILLTLLEARHDLGIYDTQCGFKLFKSNGVLPQILSTPFQTRWFIDLEVLLRWRDAIGQDLSVWEEPLMGWEDVAGSKLGARQFFSVIKDLARLLVASTPRPISGKVFS